MNNMYYRLAWIASVLALMVILLGAYTRLKDAGLGCPDWPGCYGHFSVPRAPAQLEQASQLFPNQVVETKKAWLEMIHRYFAGTLGLLICALTLGAFIRRRSNSKQPVVIPSLLFLLVIFQAALGMWTVTLSLLPIVVVGHLLGGILIAACLWILVLSGQKPAQQPLNPYSRGLKAAVILGILFLFIQLFLGGWVSSNYAALVCPDFPGCHGKWLPELHIREAFTLFSPVGMSYEGGVLNNAARSTIQMVHRYGALVVFVYVGGLSLYLIRAQATVLLRRLGGVILALLGIQILLGILNVVWMLPVPIALAHNVVAVFLFLSMVTLGCRLFFKPSSPL